MIVTVNYEQFFRRFINADSSRLGEVIVSSTLHSSAYYPDSTHGSTTAKSHLRVNPIS